jgi:hypothetical protein
MGGGISGAEFVSLFGSAPHDVSTFQVQIHPWIVVSTGVGAAVSVVPPHVQFHTHTHVLGRPFPGVGGAGAETAGVEVASGASDT